MSDYLGIITPQDIQVLRRLRRPGVTHPLVMLALGHEQAERHRLTAHNTESAACLIKEKDPKWLNALKSRLVADDDFTHASSALGEIRAYGALLETGMNVAPAPSVQGSNVSPEFEIDNGDGRVIVEVHSRQLDEKQSQSLDVNAVELQKRHKEEVEKARAAGEVKNVLTMGEVEVFPTGAPDPAREGDSVLTNTISRIAAIKQNEKQVDPNKPFILWLDLQDQAVWGVPPSEELFSPLYSEGIEGYVGSGPFWFALYALKGDPLIESRGYDYRSMPMAHDGRFEMTMKAHGGKSRVSAVIYSLPYATFLMENPNPTQPIPPRVRATLLKLPRFRLDRSIVEWKPGLVARHIAAQRQSVLAAAAALGGFDPWQSIRKTIS